MTLLVGVAFHLSISFMYALSFFFDFRLLTEGSERSCLLEFYYSSLNWSLFSCMDMDIDDYILYLQQYFFFYSLDFFWYTMHLISLIKKNVSLILISSVLDIFLIKSQHTKKSETIKISKHVKYYFSHLNFYISLFFLYLLLIWCSFFSVHLSIY